MSGVIETVTQELVRIIDDSGNRILRNEAETLLAERYSSDEIFRSVNSALDTMMIDQILDRPPEDSEIDEELVWYLRIPYDGAVEELRNLKAIDFALIRILQKQNEAGCRGEMKVAEARQELRRCGLDDSLKKRMFVKGRVDYFWITDESGREMWCRLIPECELGE